MEQSEKRHKGRISQIPIYLGKFFRMFIYMDDWKAIPMAVIIAALVALVACKGFYQYMEGTFSGSLALVCVCIWNGFFNSIQVVCRERAIIKREHRSGMYITSYLAAHMIYQGFLCLLQSVITIAVCFFVQLPVTAPGVILPFRFVEMGITFFLITYAADMLSLCVSCIVRTTTAAMTVMPFLLIIQLIFSGGMFQLGDDAKILTNFTISKWGMESLCIQGNYNELPMVSTWNMLFKYQDYDLQELKPYVEDYLNYALLEDADIDEASKMMAKEFISMTTEQREEIYKTRPVWEFIKYLSDNGKIDDFMRETASVNYKKEYVRSAGNLLKTWGIMAGMSGLFALFAGLSLMGIDRDKR